ncbi:coiled-coil domain-containing protein 47-like [Limulus polyphemus]|uniref:PAT complex subunit CCDC47 n=1 Tax=Limulus polyphemus TaxID=6850 RepID=A0ABM1BGQ6_LIMPO|nr:coiled-coil domain-containing protein 47-like [Limulus polyphemus]XP_022249634.1 coiled-coil domain-containing protein 47-like [Limulus polyphemus]
MRLLLLCIILSLTSIVLCANHHQAEVEDNEFAEFEEFDEDEVVQEKETKDQTESKPTPVDTAEEDEDEVKVEEEEEFDHFSDEEEFEGLDQEQSHQKIKPEKPDLKITKVPLHLRSNWESFYMEFLMIAGLLVYFINFVAGRNKNQKLAMAWFNSHKHLLESNFALVGDDGKKEIENPGLVKESENVYTLWCSGRVCVEGMLVELKLLKRQDLVSVISRFFRPASDQILVKVHMNTDAMDSFVFCVAKKKTALALGKEMTDLCTYCPDKKSAEKYGLSSNFTIMSEVGEASNAMLDSKVVALTKKYEQNIDYMHFSDQYSGPKLQEDSTSTKLPEVKKVLMFGFSVPGQGKVTPEIMETLKPLLQLVFYYIEKVKRFNLSKEAKTKAEKNRQKVEEAFIKTTHAQRQEAAQQRREEKRRAEKERILNEEDPEKQRKWEDREHRRELKKKAPKMKQLKVKAL